MSTAAAPLQLQVVAVEEPTAGVRTLRLAPANGTRLMPFAPGAHIDVQCGERTNAYSLIGDPRDTSHYAISVLHCEDGQGGSRYLHHEVQPGSTLQVGAPRSAFAPPAAAREHLLIAAGIGVTPFLSYARAFARTQARYTLHYVHREGADPHAGLLDLPPGVVQQYAGRGVFWSHLPELLAGARLGTHLSVCGPPEMIEAVLDAARLEGWPEHRLHSERFVGVEAPPGAPFRAILARSGRELEVPSGTTLLDAVLGAGVELSHLCRQGVCGECRVGVLSGTPQHHDLHLSEAERESGALVMACVSRCAGEAMELDL
jgi:ferredoxin-NADP reductase